MSIFLIRFEATPRPDHPEAERTGGAFINCWMRRPSLEEAEQDARQLVGHDGWLVRSTDCAVPVSRNELHGNEEALEYYDQAMLDEEVFVYHMWPLE